MKCKSIALEALKVGSTLTSPIFDPRDSRVVLVAAHTPLSQLTLNRLAARQFTTVVVNQRDLAIMHAFDSQARRRDVPPSPNYLRSTKHNDFSRELDRTIDRSPPGAVGASGVSDTDAIKSVGPPATARGGDLDREMIGQWAIDDAHQLAELDEFFGDTRNDETADPTVLRQVCQRIYARMQEDRDALVCLACTPHESDYPLRHSIHTTEIAMTIAHEMGYGEASVIDLGIGCLLHDLGMREVGVRFFETRNRLSVEQLRRLADHPVEALAIAARYGAKISEASRRVAYQLHERNDGSGYPRGSTRNQIHPLARVAAVADSLTGMLARRPHRHGILGYFAIESLLKDVTRGKLDAGVVRALLNVTSVYPLGSFVELNDGCVAKVIRSGGGRAFTRPVLQLWHPNFLDRPPVVVDLRDEPGLRIEQPIINPRSLLPARRAA